MCETQHTHQVTPWLSGRNPEAVHMKLSPKYSNKHNNVFKYLIAKQVRDAVHKDTILGGE